MNSEYDDGIRYTLKQPPRGSMRPNLRGEALNPLHPIWAALGHDARRVLETVNAQGPARLKVIARIAEYDRTTTLTYLEWLEQVGLVIREDRNRWKVVEGLDLDRAGQSLSPDSEWGRAFAVARDNRKQWEREQKQQHARSWWAAHGGGRSRWGA